MMATRWIGTLFGSRTTKELDALVTAYTRQGKFSGSVLVAKGDEVVLSKGYGLANREHNIPNTPQTVFRIGSMTKAFTAIAVMQLVEAGRLTLDDRLSTFMPDYPNGDRISIHHLLSNTSGIPDYIIMPAYMAVMTHRMTLDEVIALFRDEPLKFEPGTAFGYSNGNWALLGAIIEQLTGKPYGEAIRQSIFAPLGMNASGYDWELPVIRGRSTGYVDTGAGIVNAEVVHETTMHGAGALYSTAEDLFRWGRGLSENRLLRAETLRQMSQPVIEGTGYGYGWELQKLHNRAVVAHSGGLPGYIANFARLPDEDIVIIILSNLGSAAVPQLTGDLAAILLGEPYQMPTERAFVPVDPAVLADYVGEFEITYFGRTSVMRFALEGDRLALILSGLPKSYLSAYSPTEFYARSKGDVEMTFVRDAQGQVNTIDVVWSGHPLTARRVK